MSNPVQVAKPLVDISLQKPAKTAGAKNVLSQSTFDIALRYRGLDPLVNVITCILPCALLVTEPPDVQTDR